MDGRRFALPLAALSLAAALALALLLVPGLRPSRDPGIPAPLVAPPGRAATAPLAAQPSRPAAGAPDARAAPVPSRTAASGGRAATLLAGLAHALSGSDRDALLAAARALRTALLADPTLLAEAAAALGDAAGPPSLRAAIAAVLGSLPGEGGKRTLLAVLASGALGDAVERAALRALGTEAPQRDEEAFDAQSNPWALELAPGLFSVVRGPVSDAAARAALLERLSGASDAETRLAAARTLRDSARDPDVRGALLDRLAREQDPEVAASAAGALGAWARDAGPGDPARAPVVDRLLEAAPLGSEAVRVSLAPQLGGATLAPEEAARLRDLASRDDPEVRRFAVEALTWQLGTPGGATEENLALISRAALGDADAGVRRAGVDALERNAHEEATAAALATALLRDPEPRVRESAARALRRALRSAAAWDALRRASTGDSNLDVRDAAAESLLRLEQAAEER